MYDLILEYLKQNIGRPVYFEDIANVTAEDPTKALNNLIQKGYVYPYKEGFFLTKVGQTQPFNPKGRLPAAEYSKLRPQHAGIDFENRQRAEMGDKAKNTKTQQNALYRKWIDDFNTYMSYFATNHPELRDVFKSCGVAAGQFGEKHDSYEFLKDVHAIFLHWGFEQPELRYGPNEPEYKVPDMLHSVEHAMAESIQRLSKHSRRHAPLFDKANQRKFGEVVDQVQANLDKIVDGAGDYAVAKPGTVVAYSVIQSKMANTATKLFNADYSYIEMALNKFAPDIFNLLKVKNPTLLFSNEPLPELIQKLLGYMKQYPDAYQMFSASKPDDVGTRDFENIKKALFNGTDFTGCSFLRGSFENLQITGCRFPEADLSNTTWKNSSITGCDFEGAKFIGAKFGGCRHFTGNNINGADFNKSNFILMVANALTSNTGTALNTDSFFEKLTKEKMKQMGFKGDESFDHASISREAAVPCYKEGAPGNDWRRDIYATTDEFPEEYWDQFNLHRVPGKKAIGWIGGTYTSDTLYVTEMQSDPLQRTREISQKYYDEIDKTNPNNWFRIEPTPSGGTTRINLDRAKCEKQYAWGKQFKSKLENRFSKWQKVFMNQAVHEAVDRGLQFIMVPTSASYQRGHPTSPYQYYDYICQDYPHTVQGKWNVIPVGEITKFAKLATLKTSAIDVNKWTIFATTFMKELIRIQKEMTPGMTDKQVVHDAYMELLNSPHIPIEVREDPEFEPIKQEIKNFYAPQYGDIEVADITEQRNPEDILRQNQNTEHEDDEGAEFVGRNGEPMEPDMPEDPNKKVTLPELDFSSEDVEAEKEQMVDKLLEQLTEAKRSGDAQKVLKIKERLDELLSLSAKKQMFTKLSWKKKV